ncbi:MAG: helix-turn-helix transcriptional regulator [Candidatus Competibacter sp.]
MSSGSVRLKGRELLEKHNVTMYRLAENGAASWPTVHKYITKPETIDQISTEVLYGILIDGLGLTLQEAADMRLGDLFDFIPGNAA